MAKKRLNKAHRELMKDLVRQTVNHDEEKKQEAEKNMRSALMRVRSSIIKRLGVDSEFERNVLLKYGLMAPLPYSTRIKIEKAAGDDIGKWLSVSLREYGQGYVSQSVVSFEFSDEITEALHIPKGTCDNTQFVEVSKETYDQCRAAESACLALKQGTRDLRQKYYDLIEAAKTFEDVEAVWPRVGALREKICGVSTALTVLSADTIDTIQKHEKKISAVDDEKESS